MTESTQRDSSSAQEAAEPTLAELVLANLRVLAGVALLAAAAWGLWYGLSKLFPDQAWLQIG